MSGENSYLIDGVNTEAFRQDTDEEGSGLRYQSTDPSGSHPAMCAAGGWDRPMEPGIEPSSRFL